MSLKMRIKWKYSHSILIFYILSSNVSLENYKGEETKSIDKWDGVAKSSQRFQK